MMLRVLALSAVVGCGVGPVAAQTGDTKVPLEELLRGKVHAAETELAFTVSGKDREDLVNGVIALGDRRYTVTKVSSRGLIGARRLGRDENDRHYGEFAVFSSSFSEQTVVGKPWPVAKSYSHCDESYNSFLAVYRVYGEKAVKNLGAIPYPKLVDDAELSDESDLYCFMSYGKPG